MLASIFIFILGYLYGLLEIFMAVGEDRKRSSHKTWFCPVGPYHFFIGGAIRGSGPDGGLAIMGIFLISLIIVPPIYGLIFQQLFTLI